MPAIYEELLNLVCIELTDEIVNWLWRFDNWNIMDQKVSKDNVFMLIVFDDAFSDY